MSTLATTMPWPVMPSSQTSSAPDLGHAPLGVADGGQDGDLGLDRGHEGIDVGCPDRAHALDLGQLLGQLVERLGIVRLDDHDVGQPVAGRAGARRPVDDGLGGLLGGLRGDLQRGHDGRPALAAVLDLRRTLEVRLGAELDQEGRGGAGLEVGLELLVDGGGVAVTPRRAATGRGRERRSHQGQDEQTGDDDGRRGTTTGHEHPSVAGPSDRLHCVAGARTLLPGRCDTVCRSLLVPPADAAGGHRTGLANTRSVGDAYPPHRREALRGRHAPP